jgi:isochorismate synthase
MAVPTAFGLAERDLLALLERAREAGRRQHRAVLLSIVRQVPFCDPLKVFERGALIAADRSYWERPDERFALAGVGSARTFAVEDPHPVRKLAALWEDTGAEPLIDAPKMPPTGTGPILLGGFAFDPARPRTALWDGFPDGRMILPRYLVTTSAGASWLTINRLVSSHAGDETNDPRIGRDLVLLLGSPSAANARGEDRACSAASNQTPLCASAKLPVEDMLSPAKWQAIVRTVVQRLQQGDLRKVVLARAARVSGRAAWAPTPILRALRTAYPACVTFAVAQGQRCFLGASPERLVRLENGTVRTMALAGSIGRATTPEEDEQLGQALLQSPKDRTEHAIVVEAIRDSLAPVCSEVVVPPDAPTLLKTSSVQHLATPIVGRVLPGRTILDLVEALHPTPGVGGQPRALALATIRAQEQLDRGWYAGPVGWLDCHGDGDVGVGIRSALLSGAEATLFAGCGIVAASDPAQEYAESCWKFRPILSALEASAP